MTQRVSRANDFENLRDFALEIKNLQVLEVKWLNT